MEGIKGLDLINNFINESEENFLLDTIYKNSWDNTVKRRSQHYGIKFDYKYRNIEQNYCLEEFPFWLKILVDKFKKVKVLEEFYPNQCTINEYIPGVGIAPHIDTHSCFDDIIVSISLESPVCMYFKNKIKNDCKIPLFIPSRSILIMKDDSRYCYSHGISFRKTDKYSNGSIIKRGKRVSITFRKIRIQPCKCIWKKLCDSQDAVLQETRL